MMQFVVLVLLGLTLLMSEAHAMSNGQAAAPAKKRMHTGYGPGEGNDGNTVIPHKGDGRDVMNVAYWDAIEDNVGPGPSHEIIFIEIGEQQDATRDAYTQHVNDFLDFLNSTSLNFTSLIDDAFDEIDNAWLAGIDAVVNQAQEDYERLQQAVWDHAEDFAFELNSTYEQLNDYQQGSIDRLEGILLDQTNQTRIAICQHVDDLLTEVGAEDIPALADMLEQEAALLSNAADGAEDALSELEDIEDEVKDAIEDFEEDMANFDSLLTEDIQEFSDNLSLEINKIREEIDARDRVIQGCLDVLKSGATLNGVKADRTLKKLDDFFTSGTTTSDPAKHPKKTDSALYEIYDVSDF